jgi:hypothetical protein
MAGTLPAHYEAPVASWTAAAAASSLDDGPAPSTTQRFAIAITMSDGTSSITRGIASLELSPPHAQAGRSGAAAAPPHQARPAETAAAASEAARAAVAARILQALFLHGEIRASEVWMKNKDLLSDANKEEISSWVRWRVDPGVVAFYFPGLP